MGELLSKTGPVTPNRMIRFFTHPEENHISAEIMWEDLVPEVRGIFISGKGNLKRNDKYRRFMLQLDELLETYKPIDLAKMDESCVRRNGAIDIERFEEILAEMRV